MSKRKYHEDDDRRVKHALGHLKWALSYLKHAKAGKTADRVRLAISSCKGAQRHVDNLRAEAELVARP